MVYFRRKAISLTPSLDSSCGFVTAELQNGSFHMPDSLVAMQVKESHALALPSSPSPAVGDYTLAVAPYAGMAVGDVVTVSWKGFQADGAHYDFDAFTKTKTLATGDIGTVLIWSFPDEFVNFIANGTAEFDYSVTYADASVGTVNSPLQTINIDGLAWVGERLPLVNIENHIGTSIDPEDYPAGMTLYVTLYPGIEPGDSVILYATGAAWLTNNIQSLLVTQEMIDTGKLGFYFAIEWLRGHLNSQFGVMYQYSRQGESQTSEELLLDVLTAIKHDAPIIQGAAAHETEPNQGFIAAQSLARGVSVSISPKVAVGADIKVEVYWAGFGASGSYTVSEPKDSSDLRVFEISASAVPANMSRTVEVSYRVTSLDQSVIFSKPYLLHIAPVPVSSFRTIACTQASDGNLSIGGWPQGADFVLSKWMFMAAGQIVNCTASSGGATAQIFEGFSVTSQHVLDGKVEGKLSYEFLKGLIRGNRLDVRVNVSFDGGESQLGFPSVTLVLVA